jgi:5'-nucleotidase
MPRLPDLVVSGINYGENLSTGVSASGTVGAAIEAAALDIPALAISLQTASQYYLSYSREIDFSAARYFCTYFGRLLLQKRLPEDVNALKVDVPATATPATPWQITRLAQHRYYQPHKPERTDWRQPGQIGFSLSTEVASQPQDTDLYTLLIRQVVSVTPLSLDFTSRVSFTDLDQLLRNQS